MTRNLKFCMRQLKREWMDFLLKMLQISISLFFLGALIHSFSQQQALQKQVIALQGEKTLYVLRDNNSDKYWSKLMSHKSYNQSFVKLTETVLQIDTEFIIMNNIMATQLDNEQVDVIEVTPNFFQKYGILGSFDEKVLEEKFQIQKGRWEDTESLKKPVILGNAYRKKYHLGDSLKDGSGNEYYIIGFLDAHQFYAAPVQGIEINSLDTALLTPVYINEADNESMYNFLYSCQFLVDDKSELEQLIQINQKEKLLDTWVQSYASQLERVKEVYMNATVMEGILGISLFFFAFVGMICTMIQRLEDHAYEYTVNFLCGARRREILFRIIFEYLLSIFIGDILCFVIFGKSFAFLMILLLTIICMAILYIFARCRMDSVNLTQGLRSRG